MLGLDRSRTAGPLLEWKVRIFVVAGGLGLAGMYLEVGWLLGAAIALLLGGVLLRFSPKPSDQDEEGHGEEEDPEGHNQANVQAP